MISTDLIQLALTQITAGVSSRRIARCLSISRGTVDALRHGRHRSQLRTRPTSLAAYTAWRRSVPRRCPTCGYRVKLPCIACGLTDA